MTVALDKKRFGPWALDRSQRDFLVVEKENCAAA